MELCCFDKENIKTIKGDIYIIFYKENYLLKILRDDDMPELLHIVRGLEVNNKSIDTKRINKIINKIPHDATIFIATGNVREIFEYLSSIPYIKKYFDKIFFYPTRELLYEYQYKKKYEYRPLEKKIILRSGRDRSALDDSWEYADNVRAVFEYMLEQGVNEKYELIWIVNNPEKYSSVIGKQKNVKVLSCADSNSELSYRRDEYYEAICLAKYIFVSQTTNFVRNIRKDQIRIQLWHGCGFKSNELREKQEKKYEYMIVTSQMYAKLHARSFGLKERQLLVTGLPKNDWLFSPVEYWRSVFSIPFARKYVFWLPTYRTCSTALRDIILNKDTGMPIFRDTSMLMEVNHILKEIGVVLVVKLHPSQDRDAVISLDLSNIVMLENESLLNNFIDINQLLGHADALISDYSSVATGYMLLDRPIAFTLDDIDLYHGFHWPKEELRDWLPGEEIYDFDDFVRFIRDVAEGRDTSREKRHRLMPYFHKYTDGNSCARVLEALGITKD